MYLSAVDKGTPIPGNSTSPSGGGLFNFNTNNNDPKIRQQNSVDWVTAAGGVAQIINQQRLANENFERARQGLDPLTYQDVPGLVPTAQFGIEESTRNSTMMMVALAIGAFVLLNMTGRRSRSDED